VLANPQGFNAKVPLVWISCGESDTTNAYPRTKAWAESLGQAGIHEKFTTYSGAHIWPVWRHSLSDFAVLLFQGGKPAGRGR
jgi:S-formylglutathione hydrolase FrmB